ncbi:MAG TPA: hypothetical protein VF297_05310 [Pyrinomonadaceae bacterium]
MTNEELEGAVASTANSLLAIRRLSPDHVEAETEVLLLDFARSLISKAYEEAARVIQAQCDAKGTGCLAHCTHPESVEAVRALADSISEKGEK